MKYSFSVLLMFFLLVACSDSEAQKVDDVLKEEEQEEQIEEKDDKENEEETKEDEVGEVVAEKPAEPQYTMNNVWGFEPIDDAEEKVVLLTFDDAPDENALQMAEKLVELNAPAIFFVNGHFINTSEKKDILREIHEMGFPIGNHTMTHASLQNISEEEQRKEIVALNDQIEGIIGERPRFFRAPFGQNTDFSKKLAEEEGMLLMNWTYGYDWEAEYQDAEKLADIMVNTELLVPGANLLMHDRDWTAKAIPDIVEGFKNKGYKLLDPSLIKVD
ncbi:polysaccharide deacetylase family protein [Halobacillus seohaensis]|uniref:Polysaccharide deacetylase family protein n=1 Tax=Halobacillus seohaensis TaxID=447421 RepID=A0ABW2ELD9_9BACI